MTITSTQLKDYFRGREAFHWEDDAFDSESSPNIGATLDIARFSQMTHQVMIVSGGATRTLLWQLSNDGVSWFTDDTIAAGAGAGEVIAASCGARFGRMNLGTPESATSVDRISLMFKP